MKYGLVVKSVTLEIIQGFLLMGFRVLNNFVHIYHLLSLVYRNSVNLMTLGLVLEPFQLSNF
jgi:hypothetical protein